MLSDSELAFDIEQRHPDSRAADVVVNFAHMPSSRDFAAELITSLAVTIERLYSTAGLQAPHIDELVRGVSISSRGDPALYEELRTHVMPKAVTILRYIADSQR